MKYIVTDSSGAFFANSIINHELQTHNKKGVKDSM